MMDPRLSDIVIAVMGPTGSGKSNFVNKLTGSKEEKGANKLQSCTKGIRVFNVDRSGQHYVFVDTPGFDSTYRSDRDILRTIAEWLETTYRGGVKLAGVIYTHRITDNHMPASACKNVDMFRRVCGNKAAAQIRFVTTMWDRVRDRNIAESRLSELEHIFWQPLIEEGARHEKFSNTQQSAWDIIRGLGEDKETLLLQEELVDAERRLNETTAGKALYTQFQKLLQAQRETVKQLSQDARAQKDPDLARELQAKYEKIEAQLRETMEDIESLRIPLGRRIALFFAKKPHAHKI
ncbi:P-loop containing nucleoside triphosphate hydrolase protein [Scleroderma yunnanense]